MRRYSGWNRPTTARASVQRTSRASSRSRGHSSGSSGGTVAHIANDALEIGKFLLKLINVEFKWYDFSASTAFSAAGSINWLTSIPSGSGPSARNGSSVLAKSLQVRYKIEVPLTTVGSPYSYTSRVMVFVDNGLDGGVPAVDSVTSTANGVLEVASPVSNMSMQVPGRYTVLYDRHHNFSTYAQSVADIEEYIKLDHHLKWDETGDAAFSQRDGHIYMLIIQDQAYGTAAGLVVDINTRLRYLDN